MANVQIKRRRGSAASHASFTGAEGEFTYNTTRKTLHVHDGSTLGGLPLENAQKVASVAALKAIDVTGLGNTNYCASVLGYYAANDGGGGLFRYDAGSSAVDNGGTVITPNSGGGRWLRVRESGPVNVRWFGAKCDGSTDDTSFLNNAISYVVASSDSTSVYFDGFLRVTSTIYIAGQKLLSGYAAPAYQTITLEGDGNSTIVSVITSGSILRLGSVSQNCALDVRLKDFSINATGKNVVAIDGTSFNVGGGTFNNKIHIDNVTVFGLEGANSIGFNAENCTDCYCNRLRVFGLGTGVNKGVVVSRSNVRLIDPLIQYANSGIYVKQAGESNTQVIGGAILTCDACVRFQGGGYNYNQSYFFGTFLGESHATSLALVVDTPSGANWQAAFYSCFFDSSRADYIMNLNSGGFYSFYNCTNWYTSTNNKLRVGQYTKVWIVGSTNIVIDPASHADGIALVNRWFDERIDKDVIANGGFKSTLPYYRGLTGGMGGSFAYRGLSLSDYTMSSAGSILSLAVNHASALSGGGSSFVVAKNGVGIGGCSIAFVAGEQKKVVTFAKDQFTFAAGDTLRVLIYTDGGTSSVEASIDMQVEF